MIIIRLMGAIGSCCACIAMMMNIRMRWRGIGRVGRGWCMRRVRDWGIVRLRICWVGIDRRGRRSHTWGLVFRLKKMGDLFRGDG